MLNHRKSISGPGNCHYPSTTLLQKQFDFSLDVICAIDQFGNFKEVSSASLKVWGYHPEELMGKAYMDLVFPEDHALTRDAATRIMQGVNMTNFQNRYIRKDGSIIPILWSAHWDPQEQIMYCIARDGSERQAQEALHAQYEQKVKRQNLEMKEMLERLQDGFFALDRDFTILYWNRRATEILGRTKEEVIGQNLWNIFPEAVDTAFYQQYHQALDQQLSRDFEAYFEPLNAWYEVGVHPSDEGLSVFFKDITERKDREKIRRAYERKIQEQNKMLVELLDRMAQGFIALDQQGRVVYWNKQAEQISGTFKEEVIHKNLWDVLPERTKIYHGLYQQIQSAGKPHYMEFYSQLKNVWLDFAVYPSDRGISVFFKDITKRKETEERLETLSLVVQRMNSPVWLMDKAFRITWVNEAFTQVFGYTPEEAKGALPWELLDGPDRDPEVLRQINQKVTQGKLFQGEIANYSKEGKKLIGQMTSQPMFNAQGAIDRYFSMHLDITEQKNTEAELRKLSLIAHHSSSAVSLVELDGRISWVNEAFTRITGYSFAEAKGQKHSELLSSQFSNQKVVRNMLELFAARAPFSGVIEACTKSGRHVWLEVSGQPMEDEKGCLQRYFIIQKDITERKKMEAELLQHQKKIAAATIQAQEKERAVVGQELHDNVNQVLTSVKLYQELCLARVGNTEELLKKSAVLLQQSINDIRALSKRLSAPTLGNIRLQDSIRELVDNIAATRKFACTMDIAAIKSVEIDQEAHLGIYRILQEQLTNILKYAEASRVEIKAISEGNLLVFTIQDNGKGFNPEQKRNGMGISNMFTRAEAIGANLSIDSAPGAGCKLTLKLLIY